MAAILLKAWEGYTFLFEELPDPRTKPWLLVAKPYQGLIILGLYLMFVLNWGPKWMKDRPPFNLDKILIVYNGIQVICCLYLFLGSINYWLWEYRYLCEPVDFSNSAKAVRAAKLVYLYFMLKVIDLLDTVFFVLRKKFNQVSFLHVYHHTGMVMLIWGAVSYYPGGHGTLVGVINSFVHVVMYSYYLLTVAYPSVKKSLWWKKYITQLQIVQFFWCVVHMGLIVFKPDCAYPRWIAAVFLPQNLFMLILFIDFYIKTYIKKPKVSNGVSLSNSIQLNGANGVSKEHTN
ncbi:very long chain fatty acid elongase 4-like [Ostrinia nubilalis]|uniref:very long chain fatty acid elongase 4-like n=1 Tax=Ostrinia nubilalis TaxID=29057 RepID=UPI0030824395